MVVCRLFVVIEMVVVWLLFVAEPNDDGDDGVMNDTVAPNDGPPWATFALLPNFDTLVDDPRQTVCETEERKTNIKLKQ